MATKQEIIDYARKLGFDDIGFTTADPFASQHQLLSERSENYSWTKAKNSDLVQGTDPKNVFPEARSIIVLTFTYLRRAVPGLLAGRFGRAYIDDDRMTKEDRYLLIKSFQNFLKNHGIKSHYGRYIPNRLAAARAGVGSFGKNCFLYANRAVRQSSWIYIHPLLVDKEFESDDPTIEVRCPEWCRNTCIVACPTRAIISPGHMNPHKCIAYLSYYAEEMTPIEIREQMGMRIYGCDRCQEVCPRNEARLAQDLPVHQPLEAWAEYFELTSLLHMSPEYYEKRIRPYMFYIPVEELWRWRMNVARAMGNSKDSAYLPHLFRAFSENSDERVKGMAAWAIGRIGGSEAREMLCSMLKDSVGLPKEEIMHALEGMK